MVVELLDESIARNKNFNFIIERSMLRFFHPLSLSNGDRTWQLQARDDYGDEEEGE
jgi:hypothetical protein